MYGETPSTNFCTCFSCTLAATSVASPVPPPMTSLRPQAAPPVMDQYLNMAVIKKDENGNYILPPTASPQSVLYKYKTVMCKSWLLTKSCPYEARCKFAHGEDELRQTVQAGQDHPKFRTKPCKNFTIAGLCPFGSRCLFIHPITSTREPQPMVPQAPPSVQYAPERRSVPNPTTNVTSTSRLPLRQCDTDSTSC